MTEGDQKRDAKEGKKNIAESLKTPAKNNDTDKYYIQPVQHTSAMGHIEDMQGERRTHVHRLAWSIGAESWRAWENIFNFNIFRLGVAKNDLQQTQYNCHYFLVHSYLTIYYVPHSQNRVKGGTNEMERKKRTYTYPKLKDKLEKLGYIMKF